LKAINKEGRNNRKISPIMTSEISDEEDQKNGRRKQHSRTSLFREYFSQK
jgi:hypothetical protein